MNDLKNKILSVLFYHGDEISLNQISKILEISKKEISAEIDNLRELLKDTAFVVVQNDEKLLLGLKSDYSEIIDKIKVKEENTPLSVPALETLAIILYKKEISRYEIDEIRGVNSSYILRNLLVRGLIEKKTDSGSTKYLPSLNLLTYLGIERVEDLPAFEQVRKKIAEIENDLSEKKNDGEV